MTSDGVNWFDSPAVAVSAVTVCSLFGYRVVVADDPLQNIAAELGLTRKALYRTLSL